MCRFLQWRFLSDLYCKHLYLLVESIRVVLKPVEAKNMCDYEGNLGSGKGEGKKFNSTVLMSASSDIETR